MIILFLVFIAMIAGGAVWLKKDEMAMGGFFLAFLGAIGIVIFVALLIFVPIGIRGGIAELKAARQTLAVARETGDPIELAAIARSITEWNERIASWQYLNTVPIIKSMYPDIVDTLRPIR